MATKHKQRRKASRKSAAPAVKAEAEKSPRKKEARFTADDDDLETIARAARNKELKPATYIRSIVMPQARADANAA